MKYGPWSVDSQRSAFGRALTEVGKERDNIIVLGADTTESLKTIEFGKTFPDRFFNVGIAEQNMMAIASGLAASGKIVFSCTYSVFGTAHVYNVIRQAIAYPSLNVKIFCSHAGLTVGPDGATHQIVEDVGLMRGLPNMKVLVPSDAPEMEAMVHAAPDIAGPVYARFCRSKLPTLHEKMDGFKIGQAEILHDGDDVTIVACGVLVARALLAAEALAAQDVSARVINMSSIKPLDEELLAKAARETGAIVTAEEHSVLHGLGAAVAISITPYTPVPMRFVGVQDQFGESGEGFAVLDKYGLTPEAITKAALDITEKRDVGVSEPIAVTNDPKSI